MRGVRPAYLLGFLALILAVVAPIVVRWASAPAGPAITIIDLAGDERTIGLEATRNGITGSVRLARIDSDGSRIVHEETQLPKTVTLALKPWQMCCIEQTRPGF